MDDQQGAASDHPDHDFPAAAESGPAAADRLRAFEDENLGDDAIRIHGRIERGFGSRFKNLPVEKHRHHAALEKLVEAETKVADTAAAHLAAQASHADALKEVETAAEADAEWQRKDDERKEKARGREQRA